MTTVNKKKKLKNFSILSHGTYSINYIQNNNEKKKESKKVITAPLFCFVGCDM